MKPTLLGLLALLTGATLAGQTTQPPGQTKEPPGQAKKDDLLPDDPELVAARVTVGNAKQLAKTGSAAAVEAVLTPLNKSKANTPDWYLETAQRLTQTAEDMARDGLPTKVTPLVNQALQNLASVETKSADNATRAAAKVLAGFLQERYLADTAAALASYQAANQLAPDNKRAKEAFDRLKKVDDNVKERVARGGK